MKLALINNNGEVSIIEDDIEFFDLDKAVARSVIIEDLKLEIDIQNR
jgi:hypothetical protein